jgi:16S rRNA G1207 methylase RsmC
MRLQVEDSEFDTSLTTQEVAAAAPAATSEVDQLKKELAQLKQQLANLPAATRPKRPITCFYCNKVGHRQAECRKRRRDQHQQQQSAQQQQSSATAASKPQQEN